MNNLEYFSRLARSQSEPGFLTDELDKILDQAKNCASEQDWESVQGALIAFSKQKLRRDVERRLRLLVSVAAKHDPSLALFLESPIRDVKNCSDHFYEVKK